MVDSIQEWWAGQSHAHRPQQGEPALKQCAREILCLLPAGGTLVDVGCGSAETLSYLAPHYDQVIGLDFSPQMLEAARQRLNARGVTNVHLAEGDARAAPDWLPPADVVLTSAVAQYLSSDDLARHVEQYQRILRPGGVIGIFDIPWRNLQAIFRCGGLIESAPRPAWKAAASWLRRQWRRLSAFSRRDVLADGVGYWYQRREIEAIAREAGFQTWMVTSWYYQYRFHAILTRESLNGAGS